MPKSAKRLLRQERAAAKRLKNIEDAIPIERVWRDGVFLLSNGNYAKTARLVDVNYAFASKEDKEALFVEYSELFNALDRYRREYNDMIAEKAFGANSMVREIYMMVSVKRKKVEEALTFFNRVFTEVGTHLGRMGSRLEELDASSKLEMLHGFYRTVEEGTFSFDMQNSMAKGALFHGLHHARQPGGNLRRLHDGRPLRQGPVPARVRFLHQGHHNLGSGRHGAAHDALHRLIPVPTDETVREVEHRLLGVETNITNWTRKQNENLNYNVVVPYDTEQQRKEVREFLGDLVSRDQRMMLAVVTLVHTADTKEELDTDTIFAIARKHLCQMSVLRYQQLDGLNTALPIGIRSIDTLRTLTTESVTVLMPFVPRRSWTRAASTSARMPSRATSSSPTSRS